MTIWVQKKLYPWGRGKFRQFFKGWVWSIVPTRRHQGFGGQTFFNLLKMENMTFGLLQMRNHEIIIVSDLFQVGKVWWFDQNSADPTWGTPRFLEGWLATIRKICLVNHWGVCNCLCYKFQPIWHFAWKLWVGERESDRCQKCQCLHEHCRTKLKLFFIWTRWFWKRYHSPTSMFTMFLMLQSCIIRPPAKSGRFLLWNLKIPITQLLRPRSGTALPVMALAVSHLWISVRCIKNPSN